MSKLTRRSFLEQTLVAAAAGLAAAQRLPSVEGKEKEAAAAGRGSANERIGIAVVGLHSRGLDHLDGYSYDESVDIVALVDVDESVFAKAQKRLQERGRPAARQYTDIRKMLEDKNVNAVSIATPHHWHALAALWSMQAGKDVYVEKPVSHNVSEGRRLEEARVKYDRICQAGTQWRSNRPVRNAIQFIHEGKLGKLSLSRGLCYKRRESIGHFDDSPVPAGVHYDLWQGPAAVRPFNQNRFHYNWHWNWDYGNGDLGNQGIHQMDLARWALQKQLAPNVLSVGGRFGYSDDGQTANTQLSLFDYGDSQLLFEVRGLPTKPLLGISIGNIIYGTEGMVAMGVKNGAVLLDKQGKLVSSFKGGDSNHFGNFIASVRSRKQEDLHAPVLEGHLSSALCHMGNISYRLGEPQPADVLEKTFRDQVNMSEAFGRFEKHLEENALKLKDLQIQAGPRLVFDPAAENFGDNQKANAFLTREYRTPFVVPEKL